MRGAHRASWRRGTLCAATLAAIVGAMVGVQATLPASAWATLPAAALSAPFALDRDTVTFPITAPGADTSIDVHVTNTGEDPAIPTFDALDTDPPFTFENLCTSPLAPGESCPLRFTFGPSLPGTAGQDLTVTIDGSGFPLALHGLSSDARSVDDAFKAFADTSMNVPNPGILANDVPTANWWDSPVVVDQPAHGTVLYLGFGGSLFYEPDEGFTGTDTFTYAQETSVGGTSFRTAPATVTITVTTGWSLHPQTVYFPLAQPGEQVSYDVVLTHTGAVANTPEIEFVQGPAPDGFTVANQCLTPVAPGGTCVLRYTYLGADGPAQYSNGTVVLIDGAFVDVSLIGVTDTWLPADDTYQTAASTTLDVPAPGVLANDTLGTRLMRLSVVTGPSHGSLTLHTDGSLQYTPDTGYAGTDTFDYRMNVLSGDSEDPTFPSRTATVTLTITAPPGHAPHITSPNTAIFAVGSAGSFTVTTTGSPTPTLSLTGPLPAGVTFDPTTGHLTGTPATGTTGRWPLTLHADNNTAPAAAQEFALVVIGPLPLPDTPPTTGGTLIGVPSPVPAGTDIVVSGHGFAPGAPVTIGMYTTPTPLGTTLADNSGAFRATVTVPADARGVHTFTALGIAPDGTTLTLLADALVTGPTPTPPPPGTPPPPSADAPLSSTAAPRTALAATGAGLANATALAVFLLVGGGAGLLAQGRRRHRRGPARAPRT